MLTQSQVVQKSDAQGRSRGYDRVKITPVRLQPRSRDNKVLTQTTEADLICAVRDHQDRDAFADLFSQFAPRIKAFLMKSGVASDQAEDHAQDVMAIVWQKAHLFDPARASASTWIFTIARNKRIDAARRAARPTPDELPWGPSEEPDQADALALQEDTTRLTAALRALPEKQRSIITRAYYGDLTQSELAAETGLPLGTIKSRMRLALERLRRAMEDEK